MTESEKAGFQVMDVEAMRFHYSHARGMVPPHGDAPAIIALYDETACGCSILAGAEQSFRYGGMVNWQLIYVKDRAAIPMTGEFVYEESARLRALGVAPQWHLTTRRSRRRRSKGTFIAPEGHFCHAEAHARASSPSALALAL